MTGVDRWLELSVLGVCDADVSVVCGVTETGANCKIFYIVKWQ